MWEKQIINLVQQNVVDPIPNQQRKVLWTHQVEDKEITATQEELSSACIMYKGKVTTNNPVLDPLMHIQVS